MTKASPEASFTFEAHTKSLFGLFAGSTGHNCGSCEEFGRRITGVSNCSSRAIVKLRLTVNGEW